jgi:hypothetical protein
MTRHHARVRAVLLVHGLEADRRLGAGEVGDPDSVVDLTDRVIRIQTQLVGPDANTTEADCWLLAVYDAALAELCAALGVDHSLVDEWVCSERERQRVELELLSSVLPLAR